jgi:hypothetical protein
VALSNKPSTWGLTGVGAAVFMSTPLINFSIVY